MLATSKLWTDTHNTGVEPKLVHLFDVTSIRRAPSSLADMISAELACNTHPADGIRAVASSSSFESKFHIGKC